MAGPGQIGVTLFLEHPAEIDYRLMIERIGKPLEIDPKAAEQLKPGGTLVLPASGDVIMGLRIDAPYPEPLDRWAVHAYWWPRATQDLARSTSHLMVFCAWSGLSRLDAHRRHLILVRELVAQLPVIGILWGSVLLPAEKLKNEFAVIPDGLVPFSLWVLIQASKQPSGNVLISTIGMRDFGRMEIEMESSVPLDQT